MGARQSDLMTPSIRRVPSGASLPTTSTGGARVLRPSGQPPSQAKPISPPGPQRQVNPQVYSTPLTSRITTSATSVASSGTTGTIRKRQSDEMQVLQVAPSPSPNVAVVPTPKPISSAQFVTTCLPLLQKLRKKVVDTLGTEIMANKLSNSGLNVEQDLIDVERMYHELDRKSRHNVAPVANLNSNAQKLGYQMFESSGKSLEQMEFVDSVLETMRAENTHLYFFSGICDAMHSLDGCGMFRMSIPTCVGKRIHDKGWYMTPTDLHTRFLSVLKAVQAPSRYMAALKAHLTLLDNRLVDTVLQIDIGAKDYNPYVAQIRMVCVVNEGLVDDLVLGNPKEILYVDGMLVESKHEVYRLMTVNANSIVKGASKTSGLYSTQAVFTLINCVRHYLQAFSAPCAVCGKMMRDFLPPTRLIDYRNLLFAHESCAVMSFRRVL